MQSISFEQDVDAVHVVLLGDSTLDNGRYLNRSLGDLSVGMQLEHRCDERNWEMTMLAQDGSLLEDVMLRQLPMIPRHATHVVLSCSGNDLLALLNRMVVANFTIGSVYGAIGEGLKLVAEQYRELIAHLKSLKCHVACCTVYRPNFNQVFFKSLATFSLGIHNSRLMNIAEDLGCSVLDLANILEGKEDFANPLELSTRGGAKVVENITNFVNEHPSRLRFEPRSALVVHSEDKPCASGFPPFGLKCCTSSSPAHSIYASKVVPQMFESPNQNTRSLRGSTATCVLGNGTNPARHKQWGPVDTS